jgi:hypothetical protein
MASKGARSDPIQGVKGSKRRLRRPKLPRRPETPESAVGDVMNPDSQLAK